MLSTAEPPRRVHVPLPGRAYDVLIGPGLVAGAGTRDRRASAAAAARSW